VVDDARKLTRATFSGTGLPPLEMQLPGPKTVAANSDVLDCHGALQRAYDVMGKERIEGIGKQIAGSVKEAVGKVTGDAKIQAEGTAEKATGNVQNTVGVDISFYS
jgi:uncharacterized protein YjbJ (UPF0337 family)